MSQPAHAVVLHRFDASAGRVFEAWFDPVWLGRWRFGPGVRDERIVRLTLAARVGGKFSFVVGRRGAWSRMLGAPERALASAAAAPAPDFKP